MRVFNLISTIALVSITFWSCKRQHFHGLVEDNKVPPGMVTDVKVTNGHGIATISYALPDNKDILYVKAVYKTATGIDREVKASYYTNKLVVDGFADTMAHQIELYAVNRSETASKPVMVTVKPLIAPIQIAFNNMTVEAAAGGVRIKTIDPLRSDIVIVPLIDTLNNGEWQSLDNVYTNDSIIGASIRGLPPVERKFAFFVRDRWLNHTDTLFATITPKYEIELDKSKFFTYQCDNDSKLQYNTTVDMMWDGRTGQSWPCLYTDESSPVPTSITFGISGVPVKLTRIKLITRNENSSWYSKGSPRVFEVWGSNDPTHDGDWSKWDKLLTCHVVKPSGLPNGQDTNADNIAGAAGFIFDFDEDTPPYRYLRIRCLQNWSGTYFIEINQIYLWGTN